MRNPEISSPGAAELYFNHSIFGQLYTLIAEALGRGPRRTRVRGVGRMSPAAGTRQTLLERLDTWFWRQAQKDREAYLARSADVFDLERRIKALERETPVRYY